MESKEIVKVDWGYPWPLTGGSLVLLLDTLRTFEARDSSLHVELAWRIASS